MMQNVQISAAWAMAWAAQLQRPSLWHFEPNAVILTACPHLVGRLEVQRLQLLTGVCIKQPLKRPPSAAHLVCRLAEQLSLPLPVEQRRLHGVDQRPVAGGN